MARLLSWFVAWVPCMVACGLACVGSSGARGQGPVGTGFAYQGKLESAGLPATGTYDFRYRLYTVPAGGSNISSTLCVDDASVEDGLFSAVLDFGAAYDGTKRYLEIEVRVGALGGCASGAGFVTLAPRQELTPAPHAIRSVLSSDSSALGGQPSSAFATLAGANVFTGVNTFSGFFTGVGCSTRLTGAEMFGLEQPELAGSYTGMYIRAVNATSKPFYGYDAGRQHRWWTYLSGADNSWRLSTSGTDVLTVASGGNLGVGTTEPLAKLDVRGNIRAGTGGELFVPGSSDNSRIIAGRVSSNGNPFLGTGYTSQRLQTGYYRITYTTPFPGTPIATVTPVGAARIVYVLGINATVCDVITQNTSGAASDIDIMFTIVGPR